VFQLVYGSFYPASTSPSPKPNSAIAGTPFGTEALKAVDVARALGFFNTIKATLNFDELVEQLEAGYYPIILVNLLPIDGIKDAHAIVSLEAKPNYVKVYDPLKGERILPTSTLMTAWTMMSNLTILVIP
jgi:hypothetical protein